MRFSALLREAIRASDDKLTDATIDALSTTVLDFLQAWVAIHEPDGDNVSDPARALVLQLLEELDDRVPIPIVT